MTQMTRSDSRRQDLARMPIIATVAGAVLVALLVFSASVSNFQSDGSGARSRGFITRTGTVDDIPYYHCDGSGEHNLVLLHGAAFTKEDWKTSGIFGNFCREESLTVVAMDLPVAADYEKLKELLRAMEKEQMISLPVAVVTPSASGKTMTSWMTDGQVSEVPEYISKWIPVAAGSVAKASDEEVKSISNVPIFAIYGSKDTMGKEVTERLGLLAGAKTLELEGRHPVYLDSPNEFVSAVLEDLGIST